MVRLHYVDNLRWISVMVVLLLHAACIFTGDFYVFAKDMSLPGLLLIFSIFAWVMPLMFCLAGLSTKFALQKRSPTMYLKERVTRLLVPFIAGMILISPVLGYFALKFHTGFTGSYAESFVNFFTTNIDLSSHGFTGHYSVQHLWFILLLFIISVVALGVILLGQRQTWIHLNPDKIGLPALILVFIPICLLNYLQPYISGASAPSYFIIFLLGYYLFSRDTIQNLLEKHWKLLLVSWVVLTIAFLTGGIFMGHAELLYGTSPLNCLAGWMGVLALMGTGKHLINTTSSFSAYMGAASYPVYIIHLPIMVAIAYYVLMLAISPVVQFLVILTGSFLLTFACYEILKRIPGVRVLFGIAGPRKKTA